MNRRIYRIMGEVDAKQNIPRRKFSNDAWQSHAYSAGYDAVLHALKREPNVARGKPTHKPETSLHDDVH